MKEQAKKGADHNILLPDRVIGTTDEPECMCNRFDRLYLWNSQEEPLRQSELESTAPKGEKSCNN